jgi:hypothetical protein
MTVAARPGHIGILEFLATDSSPLSTQSVLRPTYLEESDSRLHGPQRWALKMIGLFKVDYVTDHRSPITDHRSPITDHPSALDQDPAGDPQYAEL